jgi:hypothetical protein
MHVVMMGTYDDTVEGGISIRTRLSSLSLVVLDREGDHPHLHRHTLHLQSLFSPTVPALLAQTKTLVRHIRLPKLRSPR